jgi:hypothetical protein
VGGDPPDERVIYNERFQGAIVASL